MKAKTALAAFHDFHPETADFLRDVSQGLRKPQKEIPAKYFYDERGSALFDAICELPEYYPTRTEIGLLETHGAAMADVLGAGCAVIEYGSGSSQKISLLLSALHQPVAYLPIDISKEHLLRSSDRLAADWPGLPVIAVCADYHGLTHLPPAAVPKNARKIIFFPGSTIGNAAPLQAIQLLKTAAGLVGPGGGMLIGVDLKKESALLHAAYNDTRSVTAQFNLNLLTRANRELGADFQTDKYRHHAFYHAERGRIEMHLISDRDQTVHLDGGAFSIRKGESIHTENSYKYSIEEFQTMAQTAGFRAECVWIDADRLFSLHYLNLPAG